MSVAGVSAVVSGTTKIIALTGLQDSPVFWLLDIHTDKISRRLEIKGDPHHRRMHAVQHVRIRRAPSGPVGGVNAAGVGVNRAAIA